MDNFRNDLAKLLEGLDVTGLLLQLINSEQGRDLEKYSETAVKTYPKKKKN